MAMNARFWFTRAYNRALEKYDGLIMPTVNFVARKLPDKDIKLDGKNSMNFEHSDPH